VTSDPTPRGPEDRSTRGPEDQELGRVHEAQSRAVLRRVRIISLGAWIAFSIGVLALLGWRAFLGLTCSGLVVMINFFLLEEIVQRTLQPAPQVKSWGLIAGVLARFALLGIAIAVTIVVARFEPISVILGFSVVVVGIMGEAVYSVVKSFSEDVEEGD